MGSSLGSTSDLETFPDLDDTYPWRHLAEAYATLRRVEKLVDKWDHKGKIEAHQLLDALDQPHETGT